MRLHSPLALRLRGIQPWQRELTVLWIAQATSSLGFSFFFPFIPLFIQELGVTDPQQAALWSGISGGIGGFFMVLSGPVWGVLGDRYGLKKNVLRAMVGSAIIIGLTGLVTDVYQLVAARMMLGLVSGTWVTVMALAASKVQRERVPFAIGVIQSASFLGFTIGPFIGGTLADAVGFRATFFITGLISAFSAALVLFLVKESIRADKPAEKLGVHLMFSSFAQLVHYRGVMAVMITLLLVQLAPTMMMPTLPLFVATLSDPRTAASNAGIAFSLMGLTGAVSSMLIGRLTRQLGLVPVLIGAFIGGGVTYLPLYFVNEVFHIYVLVSLLGLFNGGLNTLSYALVGTSVPADKQGVAYGMAQSASSLGWGGGPLAGGAIAGIFGLRPVFLVNAAALLISGALVVWMLGRGKSASETEAAESQEDAAARQAATGS
ncbi:MAG: MFS transporter [Chloroflexi bacterium]|nr:MFS transporter [Chloroflexota bacterium]